MTDQNYLLIIDDTPFDTKFCDYFAQFGFQILQESNFDPNKLIQKLPVALLIKWSLIQGDPKVIKACNQQVSIPIIIISDSINEEICVRMLEAGADDFMVKPLNPRELHARISAIARRLNAEDQATANSEKEVLYFGKWRLHPSSRQLFSEETNEEQPLSSNEYDLLLAFVRHPQQALEREFLSQITHSGNSEQLDRRIDVQISRLRQKIEMDPAKPEFIKTIRNRGYMFTGEVTSTRVR